MSELYLPSLRRKRLFSARSTNQSVGYQILAYNIPNVWSQTQGEGVVIAVLDTGCQTNHPDLIGATVQPWNVYTNGPTVTDIDGHGTHIAGTIAARNNGLGMVGVAPMATIMPIKVLNDEGYGTFSDIARGIRLAVDRGAHVINMSLGGEEGSQELHDACRYAYANNVPVLCAAGNSGDVEALEYPAAYDETISIGAIDRLNLRADFSTTGLGLDFVAPGVDIYAPVPVNQWQLMSGTSMATAWASGVVALMIAKHRKYGGSTPINNVEDVREHLKATAIDLEAAAYDTKTGFGLIDVEKALENKVSADETIAALKARIRQLERDVDMLTNLSAFRSNGWRDG